MEKKDLVSLHWPGTELSVETAKCGLSGTRLQLTERGKKEGRHEGREREIKVEREERRKEGR